LQEGLDLNPFRIVERRFTAQHVHSSLGKAIVGIKTEVLKIVCSPGTLPLVD